jgi:hypothetical protein
VFLLGISVCSSSGDHSLERCRQVSNLPYEDLAKYGYEPEIKYKYLTILL